MLLTKTEAMSLLLGKRLAAAILPLTNYFGKWSGVGPFETIEGRASVVVIDPERDFGHVLLASSDPADLADCLKKLPPGRYVLDYLSKNPSKEWQEALLHGGFRLRETYQRLAGPMPKFPAVRTPTDFATEADFAWFSKRMPELFDPSLDHLPSESELRSTLLDRRLIVNRHEDRIVGFFLFDVQGVRAHLHYWWSDKLAGPSVGLDVLIRGYHEIALRGVKFVHVWVNLVNERVLAVHKRFGLKPDGLWNFIYGREHP